MMTGNERESFAASVIEEVRRWPGVETRPLPSATSPGETDGVEFRLYGRQIGHVHRDCSVHLALTKALKSHVVEEKLAEPVDFAPTSGWTMFEPVCLDDRARAVWLLRLNYVRLRRQRLTPQAAARSTLIQEHQAALGAMSPGVSRILDRTQARPPRPFPALGDLAPSAPSEHRMPAEHEVHRTADAEPGPQKVQPKGLLHVEEGKGDEHGKGDGLLNDLELS